MTDRGAELPLHVATLDFPAFYAAAAGSLASSKALYESVSNTGTEAGRTAKTILNQAGRMVWLSDQLNTIARGRPALQVLFYMIAAEAVAKLATGYEDEDASRRHVRLFFDQYATDSQRQRLHRALESAPSAPHRVEDVPDYLYGIRCDVAHRGRYFGMLMEDEAGIREVRSVVLEIAVNAAKAVAANGLARGVAGVGGGTTSKIEE